MTTSPSTLKDKINVSTLNLVLLSVATAGIYLILWISRHYPTIDRVTGAKTADENYVTWMAICLGLYGAFADPTDETMLAIAGLLYIGWIVLVILWAFRARKAIEELASRDLGINFSFNPFLTFVFNVFYVNYCINKLGLHSPQTNQIHNNQSEAPNR